MNCWYCDRPSHGICRFCGRAICRNHHQKLPFVLSVFSDAHEQYQALVVGNTLWCGTCQPKDEPVRLQELEKFLQSSVR